MSRGAGMEGSEDVDDPDPPPGAGHRQARFLADLEALGVLRDRAWRAAFGRVDRHLFIPQVIWSEREEDGGYLPVDRSAEPRLWGELVHQDVYLPTQVDDGREPEPGAAGDWVTSSMTKPSLVLDMLHKLRVVDGAQVLEVGTGTGYTAALLCERLGERNVTTVEVDAGVAAQAHAALSAAGRYPTTVHGDGAAGYLPNAPYDRIIATCAVRWVPAAWVAQTAPGGLILVPWGTGYHPNALLRLAVPGDGTASGHFLGEAAFMWLREQRVSTGRLEDFVYHEDDAVPSTTDLDPGNTVGDPDAEFAIGLRAAGCQYVDCDGEDGPGRYTLWLVDGHSWAAVDYRPDATNWPVRQYGPRRLWDEVVAAYRWWDSAGRPSRERFGLTVTPKRQTVWLDSPDSGVAWDVPEP